MSCLKTLPIAYSGRISQASLINFAVDVNELLPEIPAGLSLYRYKGSAVISLADLQLSAIRPDFLPECCGLNYRHVALRVLIDQGERAPGVFFWKSFCMQPLLVCGGRLFTDYRLSRAEIRGEECFHLRQGDRSISYRLDEADRPNVALGWETASLNTAYAMHGRGLWQTRIRPEQWPLKPMRCHGFQTSFFRSANCISAFKTTEVLPFYRSAPLKLNSNIPWVQNNKKENGHSSLPQQEYPSL